MNLIVVTISALLTTAYVLLSQTTWLNFFFDLNIIIAGKSLEGIIFEMLTFFPILLLVSTITFFLPGQYFEAWWNVTKFLIPFILLLSFITLLGFHHPQGASGFINFEDAIDRAFILLLYAAFSLVSAWILLRTYLRSREDRT